MALIVPQTNTATRLAIQKSAAKITRNLTPNRLVQYTDGQFASADPLTDYIAGTANEIDIADDGDGTITIGIVNPLIVAKGGTGLATITDGGLLLGSGTGAITPLAQATNGQLPIGSTGADPSLATLTAGLGIEITNGAGSITVAHKYTKITANGAAVTGCTTASSVTDLQSNDANTYSCSEVAATPNYLIVDFTGVTAFNQVEIIAYYAGNSVHNLVVQLEVAPFDSTTWITFDSIHHQTAATNTFENYSFFIGDDSAYINSGVVNVRFLHSATESNGHTWGFNLVALHK